MKVFVTGASGFIGTALCRRLSEAGHEVTGLVRRIQGPQANIHYLQLDDIGLISGQMLVGSDVVIHTAGLAHQTHIKKGAIKKSNGDKFHQVNVLGTIKLAQACVEAKVPRLLHLSSTKAVGEASVGSNSQPNPMSPYGKSKRNAEIALEEIQAQSAMDITLLRIPLTYGIGVKGNFPDLLRLARSKLPLPLSSLQAKRSYLYLENLLDFLEFCLSNREVANKSLYLSDVEPISLGDMLAAMAAAQGNKLHNLPLPLSLVKSFASVVLPSMRYRQLFEDCVVDINETTTLTGWRPRYSSTEGIIKCLRKDLEA